ncbi:MAG: oligosaccharide flippase family protein [Anaerolineae bacterium]|nr:oligosaccharide flippase family protein [Anaerolineae bacterium]
MNEPPDSILAAPPASMSRHSAKRELARGFGWRMGATLTTSGVQFLVGIAIARLVAPEAYGLYALISVFVMLGNSIGGVGMEQAVVQAANIEPYDLRIAFTTSTAASCLMTAILWLGAALASPIMHEPALTPLLRWGSLAVLAQGLGAAARGSLLRSMRFRELAIAEVGGTVFGNAVVPLVLAVMGFGASALVAGLIAGSALRSVLNYAFAKHSLKPALPLDRARPLLIFGAGIASASLLNWLATRGSSAVGGIVLGVADLGLYNRGLAIAFMPVSRVFQSASYALYPTACRMRESASGLEWLHLRILEASALTALPVSAFAVVFADSIIVGLLGSNWVGAVIVVRVLGLVLFARAAYNLQAALLRAAGAIGWLMAAQGVYGTITTGLTWWLGSVHGLAGASAALALGILTMFAMMTWRASSISEVTWNALCGSLRTGLLLGIFSFAVCLATHALCHAAQISHLATLGIGGVTFVVTVATYLVLLPESITGQLAKNALSQAWYRGKVIASQVGIRVDRS